MTIELSNEPQAFQQLEHRIWETISDGYEQHFSRLTSQSVPATLDAARVGGGMRILDVCTGPGMLAAGAVKRGTQVIGLDFSDEAIEIARRNVPEAEFQKGDAQDLPFEDDSFDAVVCGFGLIHIPNPAKALTEIRRVLKSGGRVSISTWDVPTTTNGFGLLFGTLKVYGNVEVSPPHGPDPFQFSDEEKMTTALEETGFRDIAFHFVEQTWELEDSLGLMTGVLEGTVRGRVLLQGQTKDARKAISAAIEAGMNQYSSPDGHYRVPMPAVVGAGTK